MNEKCRKLEGLIHLYYWNPLDIGYDILFYTKLRLLYESIIKTCVYIALNLKMIRNRASKSE